MVFIQSYRKNIKLKEYFAIVAITKDREDG